VIWDGEARLTGNRIERAAAVNFLNPERVLEANGDGRLHWTSVTTGNMAGMDLWLDVPGTGELAIATKPVTATLKLAEIGPEDTAIEAGGLGRRLRAFRLPEDNPHRALSFDLDIAPEPGRDSPFYVRVTQEDGHQAWSSPIYLIP
jgi:hypothetical protein